MRMTAEYVSFIVLRRIWRSRAILQHIPSLVTNIPGSTVVTANRSYHHRSIEEAIRHGCFFGTMSALLYSLIMLWGMLHNTQTVEQRLQA